MTRAPVWAAPLVPDGDEARRWAEQELSDAAYEAAQPTPIDRIAQAVGDAIARFFSGSDAGAMGPVFAVVVTIVLVAIVVIALLVFGRPRGTAKARSRAASALFGDDLARSAAALREDATALADAGRWAEAIAAAVRALARGLDERGLVEVPPGATVHAFARAASARFPDEADELATCASLFDDVRYLRRPGTREGYDEVRRLDDRLVHAGVPAVDG